MSFHIGDIVRVQLDPSNELFRYDFDPCGHIIDYGYTGDWCDARVVNVWDAGCITTFEYVVPHTGEVLEFRIPTPGHEVYKPEFEGLPGWPHPPRFHARIPKCDCGCDKAQDGGTHYSWCSKETFMRTHGIA